MKVGVGVCGGEVSTFCASSSASMKLFRFLTILACTQVVSAQGKPLTREQIEALPPQKNTPTGGVTLNHVDVMQRPNPPLEYHNTPKGPDTSRRHIDEVDHHSRKNQTKHDYYDQYVKPTTRVFAVLTDLVLSLCRSIVPDVIDETGDIDVHVTYKECGLGHRKYEYVHFGKVWCCRFACRRPRSAALLLRVVDDTDRCAPQAHGQLPPQPSREEERGVDAGWQEVYAHDGRSRCAGPG